MKLRRIKSEDMHKLKEQTTMKDIIIDQKGPNVGTSAMDSVYIKFEKGDINVTIKKANDDFHKIVSSKSSRQGFMGRIHDNLRQLFPSYNLNIKWESGFEEKNEYTLDALY